MPNFCTKCGMPASGASFCVKCGANLRGAEQPPTPQPPPPPQASIAYTPPPPQAAKAGMSTLAKVAIAGLVIIVVVGAAAITGAIYVAHRVKQKVAEVSGGLLGDSSSGHGSSSGSSSQSASSENPCRYLSKEDVSQALKVTVVAAEFKDSGCAYMVHGDSADLTAKHMAAIGGSRGADAQQQDMLQNFASAIFKSGASQSHDKIIDENGNAPVLMIGIDNNGREQMRLEKSTLGRFPGSQEITGIGDEAFDEANAMMIIRKGNRLIRIMYTTCPCTTETIEPLARKLVAAM